MFKMVSFFPSVKDCDDFKRIFQVEYKFKYKQKTLFEYTSYICCKSRLLHISSISFKKLFKRLNVVPISHENMSCQLLAHCYFALRGFLQWFNPTQRFYYNHKVFFRIEVAHFAESRSYFFH